GISGGAKSEEVKLDKNGEFKIEVKNLQAGKYEYRFEGSNGNTVFKAFEIEEVEFALVDVFADNLKEITLTFSQPVNTASASFVSNYTTNAGAIKEVRFADDNTKVMLVLNGVMRQDTKYKVSGNVKSDDGQDITIKDEEFTASDRVEPSLQDIVQLGNKGLKLVFSEPIKGARASDFQIDDRAFNGNVNIINNEVLLTFYSSYNYLREGDYELKINGVVDFANLQIKNEYMDFEIIDDDDPPKIIDASATLDQVIIEFDEDIDPDTANRNQFYIDVRGRNVRPDSVKFLGNKAYLSFTSNRLSYSYETTIYVENVTDYSGNRMRLDEIDVLPVIDDNPPMVINHTVSEDGRSIQVFYSKEVNGKNRLDYLVEDQNGRELNIREIQGSGKEYTVYLSTSLPVGENTLYIEGVKDTSPGKNLLVPYEATIDMKDITRPDVLSYSGYGNYIIVQFNKEMDYRTVENKENYIINFNGSLIYLPFDSYITLSDDGKTVTIELPDRISGRDVKIGDNLTVMEIRGLKDTAGNDMKDLIEKLTFDKSSSGKAKAVDYYTNIPGRQGVLVDENTIKIRFNIPIVDARTRDFYIKGRTIDDVYVDDRSNEVTLYLDYDDSTTVVDGDLEIEDDNRMVTAIGTGVEAGVIKLVDQVAPRVDYDIDYLFVRSNIIELPFTEDLEDEGDSLYRRDLEIYREDDGRLLSQNDYETKLSKDDPSIIEIRILDGYDYSSHYSVRVIGEDRSNPSYIRDLHGNLALDSISSYITKDKIR
ncbi:MAG TPA: Ig-like domain-containing protein, partial [Tissierellaceae bacterium]|nr:Ig-like domain-containing protein [Tissierellaceae bacterium]